MKLSALLPACLALTAPVVFNSCSTGNGADSLAVPGVGESRSTRQYYDDRADRSRERQQQLNEQDFTN